ncbi:hypothetical protein G3I67_14435 [Orrella sp. NBD-18]|uniref:Uncharacterized protein n=1 Tax=Sheuella amnicola TaxID=2707330 RepID=A0A6B2R5W4_9BURK|nr:hypothetical protein [Sheuella amnicola]NDY84427.1 hypothetical protein [Sheuella amnicola]
MTVPINVPSLFFIAEPAPPETLPPLIEPVFIKFVTLPRFENASLLLVIDPLLLKVVIVELEFQMLVFEVFMTPVLEFVKMLIPGDEFLNPMYPVIVPSFTTVEPAPPAKMALPEGGDRAAPLEIVTAQLAVEATETVENRVPLRICTGQMSSTTACAWLINANTLSTPNRK